MKTKVLTICVVLGLILAASSGAEAVTYSLSGGTLNVTSSGSTYDPWTTTETNYAYRILGTTSDLVGTNAHGVGDRSGVQWFNGNSLPHITVSGRVSAIDLSFTDWSNAGWFDLGIIGENHLDNAWDDAGSYRSYAFNSSGYMLLMNCNATTDAYIAAVQDKVAGATAGDFALGETPGYFDFELQIETQQGTNGQGRLRINQNETGWTSWGNWLDFGEDEWKGNDDWSNVTLIANLYSNDGTGISSSVTISDLTVTAVPEPATLCLLGLGGLLLRRRKRA